MKSFVFGFEIVGKPPTLAMTECEESANAYEMRKAAKKYILKILPDLIESEQVRIDLFAVGEGLQDVSKEVADRKEAKRGA